ncbi:MAG TPA: lipid-A-disaccharide synthase [Vicinamibacteria bacterium]|nr:lipid-A-disaccharide synthase [Vicinamibacteria bacterium]
MSARPARILLSCGEASGDLYAGELFERLRGLRPDAECFGLGGDHLVAAGGRLIAHVRDVAVVGLVEVLRHLRELRGVFDRILVEADRARPDVAVLVDYPDFNLRLARELHRRRIPVVYYVSPQVWAWRRGRIRQIRRHVVRMLVLFPFEEEVYRRAGVPVTFVGHPLVERIKPLDDRDGFLREIALDPARPVVALLPGSRPGEVAHNLPPLLGGAALVRQRRPDVQLALAAAPTVADAVYAGAKVPVVRGRTHALLGAASVGVVASGTATVEAALLELPMVVVYRLSPVTYALGRPLVRLDRFAMVNLVAGRDVVPELIQGRFTAERVADETLGLLDDPARREAMRRDLREVRARLGGPGASTRAAQIVAALLP